MYASKVVASLGLFLGLATAAVNIGKDSAGDTGKQLPISITFSHLLNIRFANYRIVAWISGESECSNAFVSNSASNPCGINFTLNNGFTYNLVGCGGAGLSLDNGDGSFNSNCQFQEQNLQCGIQQQWSCF